MPAIRVAVRIVLLDPDDRVLLFEGRDLSDPSDTLRWWFTAGGGVDAGESFEEAARRELLEETGLSGLPLAGPFHRREVEFLNHGEPLHQIEHFYAARTHGTALDDGGWTELEQKAVTTWRWWSADDLSASSVQFYPEDLVDLTRRAAELV